MADPKLIDTNIIVRFILRDNLVLSPKALEIFENAALGKAKLFMDEVAIAEVAWVLISFYEKDREFIADSLLKLTRQSWVINPRKVLIIKALEMFQANNLSYIDCWLLVVSQNLGYKLETFDKKLKQLSK